MKAHSKIHVMLVVAVLMIVVVGGSLSSMALWGGKPEILPPDRELAAQETMTIAEFAKQNDLPNSVLKDVFRVTAEADLQRTLQQTGLSTEEIKTEVKKVLAFEAEEASKNWVKILAKFAGWIAFLIYVFSRLKNGKITPARRKGFLFAAVVVFGVILGSDPSPMGTVKDAIVLFAKSRIIFPPRMIAFTVMLVGGVILANKLLCSWGCQFGTLQDLIFRLNRDKKDRQGLFRQYKIPFVVSNTIRIAFLAAIILGAFGWAVDIVHPYDPFTIFNPAMLGIGGIIFIAALLVAALFVYRPWCHLFCPFGLVGWLAEKISRYHITVDYNACIACETCAKACPSTVMNAILKQHQQTIPDCFACGSCIEVCPEQAVHFERGKREMPPPGKFAL